jgi:hypothetical protein
MNSIAPRTNGNEPLHIRQAVDRILGAAPAYRHLEPSRQLEMRRDLTKVASYIAGYPDLALEGPWASQMAPDLKAALAPRQDQSQKPQPVPAPAAGAPTPASGSAPSQGSATSRVGDVTRATLNAIDFPQFVSSLIQGTFQAIVESHIQQMEAYATLLKNVAQTVDRFMVDNISNGMARDFLADQFDGFISRDTSRGRPQLRVNKDAVPEGEMPSFFKDLGISGPDDIGEDTIEQDVVPAARKYLAQQRQQTLATMVMLGINRVLVEDGEISAKLQFHIDAAEHTKIKFDENKTTTGTMSGRAGRNPFSANAVLVNTSSLNAQSDLNVRADLTGQVKVKFKSDAFPLERFADSAAIQLINQNARVPAPATPASAQPASGASGTAATPAPTPTTPPAPAPVPVAVAPATPAKVAAPATQALAEDPWTPRYGT